MTLIEKYFPKTWDDLILPVAVKESLQNISKQDGYRLLLYSSPGSGKTTTSRIMTSSTNDKILYLSGSNDFGVEVLRQKVMPFASIAYSKKIRKTVIIDEYENIADKIQDAFKQVLDVCKTTNFIFCTNEVEKVNSAIRSRCTNFDYNFINTNLVEHKRNYAQWCLKICKEIAEEYKLTIDNEGIRLLIKNNFPDFRHSLVVLQQVIDSGQNINVESISNCSENSKQLIELYELIEDNNLSREQLYQAITRYKGNEKDALLSLGEPFFKYLNDKGEFDKTLESAMIISKYYDSYINSINKFVTFYSCIIELKTLFR